MTTEKITLKDAELDNISGGLTYNITKGTNPETGKPCYKAAFKLSSETATSASSLNNNVYVPLDGLDRFYKFCKKNKHTVYFEGKQVV